MTADQSGDQADTEPSLEELLAHAIRMRNVNKAVGYDMRAENARIAEIRAQIRARDAK